MLLNVSENTEAHMHSCTHKTTCVHINFFTLILRTAWITNVPRPWWAMAISVGNIFYWIKPPGSGLKHSSLSEKLLSDDYNYFVGSMSYISLFVSRHLFH